MKEKPFTSSELLQRIKNQVGVDNKTPISDNATSETGEVYPSIEEQKAYWEQRDIGGNILPDRVQANKEWFEEQDQQFPF